MKIFKWFKNLELKYKVFGVIGGFYFSNHFESWTKRWWLWFNVLFCSFYSLLVIGYYLVVAKEVDWKTTVFASLWTETFICGVAIVPFMTYYFKNELEIVLLLNSRVDAENVEHMDHLKKMKNTIIYTQIIHYTAYSSLYIGNFIYLLAAGNEEYFHDPKFYLVSNPWILNINSPLQYLSFTILIGWINYVPNLMIGFSQFNTLIITYEIYVAFTILHCHISQLSEIKMPFYNFHTECHNFGNRLETNDSYSKEIEAKRRILMKKMVKAIEIYQKLRRTLKKIKTYLEFQFSVWFICVIEVELLFITAIYSPSISNIEKFRGIAILTIINIFFFCSCYAGLIFAAMSEMTTQQVYDIPWYNLDPRGRKTFYLFLHLAQKPIRFNAVKIFTMGMPVFLQIAKMSYTYANFLRNVLSRKN